MENKYSAKWMASGVIFTNSAGQVLIVKPTYKDGWEIPGGMIEENESPVQACTREIKEELGFDFIPGKLLCVDYLSNSDGRGDRIMFIFEGGDIGEREILLPKDELSEFRFIDMNEVPNLFHKRLARRIPKAREASIAGACVYLENGEYLHENR